MSLAMEDMRAAFWDGGRVVMLVRRRVQLPGERDFWRGIFGLIFEGSRLWMFCRIVDEIGSCI